MKRLIALLLCLMLPLSASAAEQLSPDAASGTVEEATDFAVFEAADGIGTVTNADGMEASVPALLSPDAVTPLEVALVLDCSGSMSLSNPVNNKSLLSYAQDAAIAFCKTLFAINPASRVSLVCYDTDVRTVRGMTGMDEQNQLSADIRGITLGGNTNTGGGFAQATALLDQEAMPGRQRVVLLLSDGLANAGAADPVQYAVQQGTVAAQDSLVYTIGLVGGMSSQEKEYTRSTLAAGYERRYFEVDFSEVADITTSLTGAFMAIAMSGSMRAEDGVFYRLWVDGGLDLRIESETGEYLSSALWDYVDTASFGSFFIVGDGMDQKMVILRGGNYRITLHGATTVTSRYTLTELRGTSVTETVLRDTRLQAHPAMCQTITLIDGAVTVTDESYEPLDIYAVDPFTGKRTRGLEIAAFGSMIADATVVGMPQKDGEKLGNVKKNASVQVLAQDSERAYLFIVFADANGQACRGWVPAKSVSVSGYVPEMIWLAVDAILASDAEARRYPSSLAPSAGQLASGSAATVLHAERDTSGSEWLYVQPAGRKYYVYVPAEAVEGWTPQTAEGFRLGYASAQLMWRSFIGSNGFTEVMWSVPQKDGDGVVLSGRTSSGKAPFSKSRGGRDAFALMMDSLGTVETAVSTGGGDLDSYHCILPTEGGYYVSGVSRSNDGDFTGIWDPSSHIGKASKTTKRTNALIGRLHEDFSIDWLKSFGSGDVSYGFDMVIELADGNIAGCGWMTASKKGALSGYGRQDFYVVKMTPDGQVLQVANFGGSGDDVPDSAVATPDGGIIMVGCRYSGGNADGWILVLDSHLNIVNQCSYGGSGNDIFDNVRMLSDGTYLVTGFTSSPSGNGVGVPKGGSDFWAMNIDSLGRSIWVKRYGGSDDEELCGTTVLDDSTCLLVGSTKSKDGDVMGADARAKDAWAICIDESGRLLWQYATGLNGNDSFNTATIDPLDGGYVLAGLCENTNDNNAKGLAVKLLPIAK